MLVSSADEHDRRHPVDFAHSSVFRVDELFGGFFEASRRIQVALVVFNSPGALGLSLRLQPNQYAFL